MRTEPLFLGNETSVNMLDHLFFLHSSFVSPSSPSEGGGGGGGGGGGPRI